MDRDVLAAVIRSWDPIIIAKVVVVESQGNRLAVSSAGARGCMQVMPYHFQRGQDWRDPYVNIALGAALLQTWFLQTGNIKKALICYNAGPAAADKPDWALPAETRQYLRNYRNLEV